MPSRPATGARLDRLHAAGDLDGDGIVDVMSNDFDSPRVGPVDTMESRTVLARSGRDGRILADAAGPLGEMGLLARTDRGLWFLLLATSRRRPGW